MSEVRIVCINKVKDSHEAITHYGWLENGVSKKTDRQTMVNWVNKGNKAYVEEDGDKAYCEVNTSANGVEFLQTYSDGEYSDNLLSLKQCA